MLTAKYSQHYLSLAHPVISNRNSFPLDNIYASEGETKANKLSVLAG